MEYNRKEIEKILKCSFYDHRTDYIWNYILGGETDFELVKYPIPNLESFQAMHDMLRRRKQTVDQFLAEVKSDSPTCIKECHYVKRSKRLSLTTRSYQFSYDEKEKRYHFIVNPNVAKSIGLVQGETKKHYKQPGMFPLSYLVELDKQLIERHEENEKVRHWIKTEQFLEDKEFCSAMIPYIMQDASDWQTYLGDCSRLNIVLRGNDKVCIGTVHDFYPEEMMSMPCFPRSEWKKGIDQALSSQKEKYEADLKEHAEEMKQWSDELSRILLGKTTFDINVAGSKFRATDDYSKTLLNSALFLKEETQNLSTLYLGGIITSSKKNEARKPIAAGDFYELDCCSLKVEEGEKAVTFTLKDDVASFLHYQKTYVLKVRKANPSINNNMLNWVDQTLQEEMQDFLALKKRKTLPSHELLIEAIRFFIKHTAPLVCYTGENERIRSEYHLQIYVDDNNQLEVTACFSDWAKQETFSVEDYRERFRVWWSQMMLRECKYAKECALDPEKNHPFNLPF